MSAIPRYRRIGPRERRGLEGRGKVARVAQRRGDALLSVELAARMHGIARGAGHSAGENGKTEPAGE